MFVYEALELHKTQKGLSLIRNKGSWCKNRAPLRRFVDTFLFVNNAHQVSIM